MKKNILRIIRIGRIVMYLLFVCASCSSTSLRGGEGRYVVNGSKDSKEPITIVNLSGRTLTLKNYDSSWDFAYIKEERNESIYVMAVSVYDKCRNIQFQDSISVAEKGVESVEICSVNYYGADCVLTRVDSDFHCDNVIDRCEYINYENEKISVMIDRRCDGEMDDCETYEKIDASWKYQEDLGCDGKIEQEEKSVELPFTYSKL